MLGDARRAVFDSCAARVDGLKLTEALLAGARAAGATIRRASVETLAEVTANADAVIIAGGALLNEESKAFVGDRRLDAVFAGVRTGAQECAGCST